VTMATQLAGGYVVRLAEVRVELSADDTGFGVTLTNSGDRIWKYNVSAITPQGYRSQSVMTGRVITDEVFAAAMRVAARAADGYEPGSVERGLFDAMAAGRLSAWQQHDPGEAARIASALRAVNAGDAAVAEISEAGL
jgi:hypothetical protein